MSSTVSEVVSLASYDIIGFLKDVLAGQAKEFILTDVVPQREITYTDFASLCPVNDHAMHLIASSISKSPLGIWEIGHRILRAEVPQTVINMDLRDNAQQKHESTRIAILRNRPVGMFAVGVDLETAAPVTSLIAADGFSPVRLLETLQEYAKGMLQTIQ